MRASIQIQQRGWIEDISFEVCDGYRHFVFSRVELEKKKAQRALIEAKRRDENLAKLQKDLAESKGQKVVLSAPRRMDEQEEDEEEDEDEDENEDEDEDDDAHGPEERDEAFQELGGRR